MCLDALNRNESCGMVIREDKPRKAKRSATMSSTVMRPHGFETGQGAI